MKLSTKSKLLGVLIILIAFLHIYIYGMWGYTVFDGGLVTLSVLMMTGIGGISVVGGFNIRD